MKQALLMPNEVFIEDLSIRSEKSEIRHSNYVKSTSKLKLSKNQVRGKAI